MTGILDRIRATTPETLANVTGDFSDAPAPAYRPRVPRDMIRTVEGADDLKVTRPAPVVPGMINLDPSHQRIDTRPYQDEQGLPSERQMAFINSLIIDLKDLDQSLWQKAIDYTARMTENRAWDRSKGGNVSRWIDRLKTKLAELRSKPVIVAGQDDQYQIIESGYYALADAGPDDIHYFRISRFRDGGIKVQEQASDTLYPVRRGSRRTGILNTLLAVNRREAMELYGRTLGHCGRCGRTLTDAESRARGIGPDCWGKM